MGQVILCIFVNFATSQFFARFTGNIEDEWKPILITKILLHMRYEISFCSEMLD